MNRKRAFKVAAKAVNHTENRIKATNDWAIDLPSLSSEAEYRDFVFNNMFNYVRKVAKKLPSAPSRNDASAMSQNVLTNLSGIATYLDQTEDQFEILDDSVNALVPDILKIIKKGSPHLSAEQRADITREILSAAYDHKDLPSVEGVSLMVSELMKEIREAQRRSRSVISQVEY